MIWISDLTRCEPSEAISRDGRHGTWIAVDYEVEEGRGVMLFTRPGTDAPPLTLNPEVEGWHEIRLGIYYGGFNNTKKHRALCVKLSDDLGFNRILPEESNPGKDGSYPEKVFTAFDVTEVFWKCADLTRQELIFSPPTRGTMSHEESCIVYVRLVPMDPEAVEAWQAELPTEKTKLLIGNYDGGNIFQWGPTTHEDFVAEFEPLRESDFDIALYAVAYGPITFYPSKVGEFIRPDFDQEGMGRVLRGLVDSGIDPFAEALSAAHECGVKLFAQNRFSGPQLPTEHLLANYGGMFMAEHLDLRCTYADGEPIRHLSFAFPEVRSFYVRMFREWVEDYKADGVNALFSRSQPFAYYEQPVCEAFEKEYGEDMRRVPTNDERVWRTRAGFVTQFLREIREMLNEVGEAQGRHIPSCYLVPVNNSGQVPPEIGQSSLAESLFHALDVPTWLKEGLADYLVAHLHVYGNHDGTGVQPKIREFTDLPRDPRSKIFIDVYPRRMPPRAFREIAINYYEAGADGLAFWDSYNRYFRTSEWAFLKRLGHRENLKAWKGKGDYNFRVVPLKRLDGYEMGREYSMTTDG